MTKGRIKFAVTGAHPYLHYVRDLLIRSGFVLTELSDLDCDFVLAGGGYGAWHCGTSSFREWPLSGKVFLLSHNAVYSDRERDLTIADSRVPMKEDDPIMVTSPLSKNASRIIRYLSSEEYVLNKYDKSMVVRTFSVYGKSLYTVVGCSTFISLIERAREYKSLPIYYPGYQIRTFLHQDDFDYQILHLLKRFLEGTTGIYNVGSDEEISMKRLADSIWQLTNGVVDRPNIETKTPPKHARWWVIPDLTRTKALTKWRPSRSLRQGLWELIEGTK